MLYVYLFIHVVYSHNMQKIIIIILNCVNNYMYRAVPTSPRPRPDIPPVEDSAGPVGKPQPAGVGYLSLARLMINQ
jgi:hypothetical protein